jgi:PncC family amidohydrolase
MSSDLDGLAGELVGALSSRNLTIATAEATTGGLIGHSIVAVPGSSAVFRGGIAPYSNAAKARLGAPEALLRDHGAVSREVAEALASASRQWFNTNIGLAETGIAGPGRGGADRPAGMFWVAVATAGGVTSRRFDFGEDRRGNQQAVAAAAIRLALESLER